MGYWKYVQIPLMQTRMTTKDKQSVHHTLPRGPVRNANFQVTDKQMPVFCFRGQGNKFFIQY